MQYFDQFISSPFLYLHDSRFPINSTIKFRICLIFLSFFLLPSFLPSFFSPSLPSSLSLSLSLSPREKLIGILPDRSAYPRSRSTRNDKPGKNCDSRSKKNARGIEKKSRTKYYLVNRIDDRNEGTVCFVFPSGPDRAALSRSRTVSRTVIGRSDRISRSFLLSYIYIYMYIAELRTTMRGK